MEYTPSPSYKQRNTQARAEGEEDGERIERTGGGGGGGEEEMQKMLRETRARTEQLSHELASCREELNHARKEVRERQSAIEQQQWQLAAERSQALVMRNKLSQQESELRACRMQLDPLQEEAGKCLHSMVEAQRQYRRQAECAEQLKTEVQVKDEELGHLRQQLDEEVKAHHYDVEEVENRLTVRMRGIYAELREAKEEGQRGRGWWWDQKRKENLYKSISHPQLPSLFPPPSPSSLFSPFSPFSPSTPSSPFSPSSPAPSPYKRKHAPLVLAQSLDELPSPARLPVPSRTLPQPTKNTTTFPHSASQGFQNSSNLLPQGSGKSIELSPQGIIRVPYALHTGVSVTHKNTIYFNSLLTNQIVSYRTEDSKWKELPRCPVNAFGLEVIDERVTLIGGRLGDASSNDAGECSSKLLSLVERGEGEEEEGGGEGAGGGMCWREVVPRMSLARSQPATACNQRLLVVAGGKVGNDRQMLIADIEVLDLGTAVWAKLSCSPIGNCTLLSAVLTPGRLYLVEGRCSGEKDVLHSVPEEELRNALRKRAGRRTLTHELTWKLVQQVPACNSTYANVGGKLVAVGGIDKAETSTNQIWAYQASSKKWRVIGRMKKARYYSMLGADSNSTLFVAGGLQKVGLIKTMEVFALFH